MFDLDTQPAHIGEVTWVQIQNTTEFPDKRNTLGLHNQDGENSMAERGLASSHISSQISYTKWFIKLMSRPQEHENILLLLYDWGIIFMTIDPPTYFLLFNHLIINVIVNLVLIFLSSFTL